MTSRRYPVYTVQNECQDCYKCVRQCPVKAIKIENGHATVMPEMCVACGHCVNICPAGAKRVRDDVGRARLLLKEKKTVIAAIAPSFRGEFGVSAEVVITALKKLGFTHVSEVALGAQQVTAETAKLLPKRKLWLSSACPAAVAYIQKYLPQHAEAITPLLSPMLALGKSLKKLYGDDAAIVFFGPCIAKKNETDTHAYLVDLALTFADLRDWLTRDGLDLRTLPADKDATFVPERAEEGGLYPIEGGMLRGLQTYPQAKDVRMVTLTGLEAIHNALENIRDDEVDSPVFVELLACVGGCIQGPCMKNRKAGLLNRLAVCNAVKDPETPREIKAEIEEGYNPEPVDGGTCEMSALRAALRRIGKNSLADELNCGGCGYETCRDFAKALINGRAEPAMCLSWLRKQAQTKANALLKCMPSGVVIVDNNLTIIECNHRYAELFDKDTLYAYEAKPGLEGVALEKTNSFPHLFQRVLDDGQEVLKDLLRVGDRIYDVAIFTIDPHKTVGGIILDVTRAEMQREQISKRAQEVIRKNLSTVQEIACRLGENMAETEILLRNLAEDYGQKAQPADDAAGETPDAIRRSWKDED